MEREILPDYAAETFYRHLIPESVFGHPENPEEEADHRVVSSKKGSARLLDFKKGVAVVEGDKNYFNDEVCMIAPSRKVVFEKAKRWESNSC